ncbi:MAG: hypothetical protein H7281_10715 [Bacteriovorax sp.]|nr:hypothetical protein [Bacteriovorax sp.]
MKQIKRLGMVAFNMSLVAITILGSLSAFGTTQIGVACPQKFIATVTNIEDVPAGAFPKVEVDFQVIQTLKGEQISSKKIQIVKDGPVQFKSGEIYTVESRENWLCSATLFSKI